MCYQGDERCSFDAHSKVNYSDVVFDVFSRIQLIPSHKGLSP
jgi:hypothetical protein